MAIFQHYTTLDALKAIIESSTLRFSDFRFTNDYTEFKHGLSILYPIFRVSAEIENQYRPDKIKVAYDQITKILIDSLLKTPVITKSIQPYLFCLCDVSGIDGANEGLLSMWRAYADDGKGIAIEFKETDDFKKNFYLNEKSLLITEKVIYNTELERFLDLFDTQAKKFSIENPDVGEYNGDPQGEIQKIFQVFLSNNIEINKVNLQWASFLTTTSMLFKHHGFNEEREYRVIIAGTNHEIKYSSNHQLGIKSGIDIEFDKKQISKIIIGPGLLHKNGYIKSILEEYVKSKNLLTEIIVSAIPYRSKL